MRTWLVALISVLFSAAQPALAQPEQLPEQIEADVSSRRVSIESDFAGIQLVVFGAVDNSRQLFAEQNMYDIAVVVRGPNEPTVVRRKDRTMGLWINRDAKTFTDVPGYYAVLSTRPLAEITSQQVLARHQIGFEHLRLGRADAEPVDAAQKQLFRDALFRIMQNERLYQERAFAVAFISRSLFRATVSLPTNVPVGVFDVDIFLFRGGELLDSYSTELRIEKSGLERFIYNLAYENSLVYGLAGVLIAVLAGLAASAAFRKS